MNAIIKSSLPLAVLLGCGWLASGLMAGELPPVPTALVTVHPDQPGAAIPADFLGFSYEKSVLADTHFRPDNTEMVNLYRNLGGGVLRLGGNKVETTLWQRDQSAATEAALEKTPSSIRPRDLDNLYAFAKQSGWRVLHGLNLAATNSAMAADEAAYALQAGGPTVLAFEVGNEPDYYPRHQLRATHYLFSQYRGEAETEQRAIQARSPNAPLAGPATTKSSDWFASFVADFKGRLALATSHFYSLSAKSKDPRSANFPTVENLLSAATKKNWQAVIGERQKAAQAAGVPFRLGECNTVSNGGTDGVSDVFASALWGADFLFDAADLGVAGLNFHGGFSDRGYTPLCFRDGHYRPHPLYYAMLLFHAATPGRMVPVECQTALANLADDKLDAGTNAALTIRNVSAHAILADDGKLRVAVINKNLAQPVKVSIASGLTSNQAQVIRLTAPSVASKAEVTLAGSAVAEDGKWTPQPGEPVSGVNGKFEISLPAASAALLTVE